MSETATRAPRVRAMIPQPPAMTLEERRQVAKLPAREAGGVKVAAFFETQKEGLAKLLPRHMTTERFLRITLNAMRVNPKLMDCTLESLFGATIFAAQVGLEPNTPQGHLYLIPFRNNKKKITEVQVVIGYQGLIALARRSGEIASISAQAVYANDDYDIDYLNPEQSRHKPKIGGARGDFIGAWAKATFRDGGMAFDFMPAADIDKIRDGSQGYRSAKKFNGDNPWISHYDQMAVKTAIRRLAKRLPLSIEMAAAVALDERDDRRASQGMHRMMERALDVGEFDMSMVGEDAEEDEGAGDDPPPQVDAPPQDERPARQQAKPAEQQQPAKQPEPEAKPASEPEQQKPADAPPPADRAGSDELEFG